jgi:mono/diheme cytochrome c family protein
VSNRPPEDNLRVPFNIRWLMAFWNVLYNPNERFKPDPAKPPEWNRGAYLVDALGHCGDCHTPRNLLQGPKSNHKFAGAEIEGWRAYNITPDRETGIGSWTARDLADYLATGVSRGHGAAAGPMVEVVDNSLRFLTPEDIDAMTAYLRSVPPIASDSPRIAKPASASAEAFPDTGTLEHMRTDPGMRMYAGACAGCHGWDGRGIAGSRAANDPAAVNLTQVVLDGIHRAGIGTPNMPRFAAAYTDAEIAALANFVTGRFGGQASGLKAADVGKRRSEE